MWRGKVHTERAAEYVEYITGTGIKEYRQTPGNRGSQMWTLDSIRGFVGDELEAAVFYPEDDDYLVDRDTRVAHFEVHSDS
jgi:hypothetical protein